MLIKPFLRYLRKLLKKIVAYSFTFHFEQIIYIYIYLYEYFGTPLQPPPPLFDLKIVYSYVIEVADSESDLGLHGRALVSEIFAFYHLLKYARDRPGRRGHVHLGHNFSIQNFFQKFFTFFCLLCS